MQFIKKNADGFDLAAYLQILDRDAADMPFDTRRFATASWHYDMNDHKCPHDSWLDAVTIREVGQGTRSETRSIEIVAKFLGAYHDGIFEIVYRDVSEYQIELGSNTRGVPSLGHGDWLIDEVLLTERKLITHEIDFSRPARWKISCADLVHTWHPL